MDYEVFFFSNLTFLEIPPSDLCFVQEAIFYDYFSKCIIFLCILLKNKNVSDSDIHGCWSVFTQRETLA